MQTVITKFLAPTNTRGARIKVESWLGNKTYSYDYAASCAHEAAFEEYLYEVNEKAKDSYLVHEGYKLVAKGSLPDGKGYSFIIK